MISQRLDIIMELGNISEKVEVIGKKPAGLAAPRVVPRRIRVGGNVVAAAAGLQSRARLS